MERQSTSRRIDGSGPDSGERATIDASTFGGLTLVLRKVLGRESRRRLDAIAFETNASTI